jgi:hypothetical protein
LLAEARHLSKGKRRRAIDLPGCAAGALESLAHDQDLRCAVAIRSAIHASIADEGQAEALGPSFRQSGKVPFFMPA